MELRDEFAKSIMAGIIAADWKFDLTEKKWDEIAAKRAYELADAMMKERGVETIMDFTKHNRIMDNIFPNSHWENLPKDTDK